MTGNKPPSQATKRSTRTPAQAGRVEIVVLISALLVLGVLLPASARAGMLSDILATFTGHLAEAGEYRNGDSLNVQMMPLPQAAMNIDPNPSKGGGDITIVDGNALLSVEGPTGTLADISESTPRSSQISIYVVREGDTLSGIAQMFNVSVNTIRWSNDLPQNKHIQVGQTLIILPVTGVRHVVADGDTISSIAEKYDGSKEEIEQFNDISSEATLVVGAEIIVPDGLLAAPAPSAPARTTVASAPQASGPTHAGYYMRPISGGVRTQGIHGYNGVDLAAPVGTAVRAAAAGTVIISREGGWNGGYGNYVVISHGNGTQTLYAHNSYNTVSQGQWVEQGQTIGSIGMTGRTTGPHVHFEIRGARNPF